eukprot:TRINITY_DN30028_c0_g1_i1.p2 TRINITY_DN30028_c0_g1~~TRINITY_DN30028_c0_g1_i1.p2  ORF type:complete len:402 (+),score=157.68 TRINITY_DN30028_c0_g1_i1:80-1285(+)
MPRITIVMGKKQRIVALILSVFVCLPMTFAVGYVVWEQFDQWRLSRRLEGAEYEAAGPCWGGGPGELPDECFTVLLSTFQRHDSAKQAVEYFRHCDRVGEVRVVWAESETPIEFPAAKPGEAAPVVVDVHYPETDLNTRFALLAPPRTAGVFSVDDDIRVACPDLDGAHDEWRKSPASLVGYYPRGIGVTPQQTFKYEGFAKTAARKRYSVVLSKACFASAELLAFYSGEGQRQAAARQMVADGRNCEDLALQFAAAEFSNGAPPKFYSPKTSVVDYGAWFGGYYMAGISSASTGAGVSHVWARSACVAKLMQIYGAASGGDALTGPLPTNHEVYGTGTWTSANGFEPISADLWAPLAEVGVEAAVFAAVLVAAGAVWMLRGAYCFLGRRRGGKKRKELTV